MNAITNEAGWTLHGIDDAAIWDDHSEEGGPDYNLGGQYSRRVTWATHDPEVPYLSITVTGYLNGYVIDKGEAKGEDYKWGMDWGNETLDDPGELPIHNSLEADELAELDDDAPLLRLSEKISTEYLGHTDPDDLGGTERWSDYEYRSVGYFWPSSWEQAYANLEDEVDSYDFTNENQYHFSYPALASQALNPLRRAKMPDNIDKD